jgi:hypothetical protein
MSVALCRSGLVKENIVNSRGELELRLPAVF